MSDRCRVRIRGKKTVVSATKDGTSQSMNKQIDRKLQAYCGFEKDSGKKLVEVPDAVHPEHE